MRAHRNLAFLERWCVERDRRRREREQVRTTQDEWAVYHAETKAVIRERTRRYHEREAMGEG